MRRRAFLRVGCACGAALVPALARAQEWGFPPRFTRPDTASDEGGLWALMDREETRGLTTARMMWSGPKMRSVPMLTPSCWVRVREAIEVVHREPVHERPAALHLSICRV